MAMENTPREEIRRIVEAQREFFRSGKTLDVKFRKESLRALKRAMEKWEKSLPIMQKYLKTFLLKLIFMMS